MLASFLYVGLTAPDRHFFHSQESGFILHPNWVPWSSPSAEGDRRRDLSGAIAAS